MTTSINRLKLLLKSAMAAGKGARRAFMAEMCFLQEQELNEVRNARNALNRSAIFIWIPKTAGTSLWKCLAEAGAHEYLSPEDIRMPVACGINTFGHIPVYRLREVGLVSDDYYKQAWKFAIVRDPFDRAVSLYKYLIVAQILPPTTTFRLFCEYLAARAFEPVGDYNRLHLSQVNPQVRWLFDRSGTPCFDFLGRFESLDRDAKSIFEQVGVDRRGLSLPKENATDRGRAEDYYGRFEERVVQEAYAEDFELLGYPRSIEGRV
jgi:hypothetical protein